MTDEPETRPAKPRSRAFRNTTKSRLSREEAKRQGEITKLAFLLLGSSGAAISLLNQAHAELGARPLDLATASDEGFATVERLVRQMAQTSAG